jgi:hypothetical protein
MLESCSKKLDHCGSFATWYPELGDPDLGRCERKCSLAVSAAREEIVEQIGKVLDCLGFAERQHCSLPRRNNRQVRAASWA